MGWYYNYDLPAFLEGAGEFPTVALDVETDISEEKNLKLIQIGLPNGHQFLYDPEYAPQLKEFLEHKTLIAHNAIFEIERMAAVGVYPKKWIDTMLIENIIMGGDPHFAGASLDKVLKRYLNVEMDKTMQTAFGQSQLTKAHFIYAAKDVEHLHELLEKQMNHPNYNIEVVKLEMDYLNVVAEMTLTGMALDVDGWKKVSDASEYAKDNKLKVLDAWGNPGLFGSTTNWNSPSQKMEVLHQNNVMVENTSKGELTKYKGHPLVDNLLEFADINSKITKLGAKFMEKAKDGIIHTSYKQIIATGRSSSRNVNLQNIPKNYRKYFSPSTPGNVFVSADFSQQELVILGYASGEKSWVGAAKRGEDLHSFCAGILIPNFAEMPLEEQKKERTKIKAINFSLAYGTGLRELARNLGVTYNDAFKLVAYYTEKFPNIDKFLRKHSMLGKAQGRIETLAPFYRVRILKKEDPGAMARKSKNTIIQGAAADMTKLACVLIAEENIDAKFVNVIHDEIVMECTPEMAENVEAIIVKCMRAAGDVICPSGYINAESKISPVWG